MWIFIVIMGAGFGTSMSICAGKSAPNLEVDYPPVMIAYKPVSLWVPGTFIGLGGYLGHGVSYWRGLLRDGWNAGLGRFECLFYSHGAFRYRVPL